MPYDTKLQWKKTQFLLESRFRLVPEKWTPRSQHRSTWKNGRFQSLEPPLLDKNVLTLSCKTRWLSHGEVHKLKNS